MGFNKKFFTSGIVASSPSAAPLDPLQNFETVTYTGNGGTQKINGYIRKGAAFNGSSSSIVVPNDILSSNFSISCWFNINNTSGNQILFEFDHENRVMFRVASTDNNKAYIGNSGYFNHGITFSVNQWYHFVLTFSNGNPFKIYVNNSLSYTGGNTSVNVFNNDNIIGAGSSSGSGAVNGKIDQFRIFNKAVSASEVDTLYNEVQCASAVTPSAAFSTVLYTGNTSPKTVTGTGFQSDFVWIKNRDNSSANHYLIDSVRGIGTGGTYKFLSSDLTQQENTTTTNHVSSLDLNGFTVQGSHIRTNANTADYVAWCWKAAASDATNNDGSIQSTVRANEDAGFSIVKWTGDLTVATIGHGLSETPELIILKNASDSEDWEVLYDKTAPTYSIQLNTASSGRLSNYFRSVNGTTFGVGNYNRTNGSGDTMIAYCFHSVAGYQSVGSYTGTGVNPGNFVTTDFEPRFLLVKGSDNSDNWIIVDAVRNTSNPRNLNLKPNSSATEANEAGVSFEFSSTGFKSIGDGAGEGQANKVNITYIYLAIA